MICFPNAKINIGLNIIAKRKDGFHSIESCMYPLGSILCDVLEIIESRKTHIEISGIAIAGNRADNLCLKAYNLIKIEYKIPPVTIYLHKAIPIGAGLGGGSADAAFLIRLINEKFALNIPKRKMVQYASELGSDCAFFIKNAPAFITGKGEKVGNLKLSLQPYHIVILYPNIHINTAKAYSNVIPTKPLRSLKTDLENLSISHWHKYIHNDFEKSIFSLFPEIKRMKEKLYSLDAIYASLSGSGSAVYGVFKNEIDAKKHFGEFQYWSGKFT